MARTRNLKPGFFKNDVLAECQPLARLLFAGLWTIADRDGRGEYRPKMIKADCLPYDDCNVDALMAELHAKGFIRIYDAGGARYFDIPSFFKHQNPHPKEQSRNIPAVSCEIAASNLLATDKPLSSNLPAAYQQLTSNVLAGPSTLSLIPSTLEPTPNHTDVVVGSGECHEADVCCEADALPEPEPKKAKSPRKPHIAFSVCDVVFPVELDTVECRDAAEKWLKHKRERGEGYKSPASFAVKLTELARAGPEMFVASVISSIGNNYAGIYPPKDLTNGNRNARPAYKPDPGLEFIDDGAR